MPLNAIETLLQEKMGLHSATVGSGTVRQAVNKRMRECNVEHLTDYISIVKSSDTELNALINTVVVPETWFFRDQNPFTALSLWVENNKASFTAGTPLRILSLPCSTGEEAYSLAMCMADGGLASNQTRIDAVDISETNLQKAGKAEYGDNSFRGANLAYRSRHFEAVENHFRLADDIVRRVHFERANLLDGASLGNRQPYHVIFCRNLLIYFDRPTQQRALDRIESLLKPEGLLFLGHSENSLLKARAFTALEYPRCFGFRRGKPQPREENSPAIVLPSPRGSRRTTGTKPPASIVRPYVDPALTAKPRQSEPSSMKRAFQLADEGHLDKAATICETLLHHRDHQIEAHYLLGVIREATGNQPEAEQLFRRTVYLDPRHFQALTHLSVIASRNGDEQNAQRFRDRAAQAQSVIQQERQER